MSGFKRFVLRRWHFLTGLIGVLALGAALYVALTSGDLTSVLLLVIAAALALSLALVLARLLHVQQQNKRLFGEHKRLLREIQTTRRAVRRVTSHPASDRAPVPVSLTPVMTAAGLIRSDAEVRHGELLQMLTGVNHIQGEMVELRSMLQRLTEGHQTNHEALVNRLGDGREGVMQALTSSAAQTENVLRQHFDDSLTESSALAALHQLLAPTTPMPTMGGFAVTPHSLLTLVSTMLRMDDPTVVECGSGTSTVWLALACARVGSGHVVALEHDEKYATLTRRHLQDAGLTPWADVRSAPLQPISVGDETHQWYAPESWDDLSDIDLLLVDGPPGRIGPWARFPALPLLADRLTEGAVVAVDDCQRPSEQATIRRWLREYPSVRLGKPEKHGRTTVFVAGRGPSGQDGELVSSADAS